MSSKNKPTSELIIEKDSSLITYFKPTDKGGYFQSDLIVQHLSDGAISIRSKDGSEFIYVYPEQVPHLKRILEA